eukprot:Opistho-2@96191
MTGKLLIAALLVATAACMCTALPTLDLAAIQAGEWTQGETVFRDKSVYVHESKMHTVVVDKLEYTAPLHPLELIPRIEKSKQDRSTFVSASPIPDQYYHFIPEYIGTIRAGEPISWDAPLLQEQHCVGPDAKRRHCHHHLQC